MDQQPPRQFDTIAPVYDATRDPLRVETLDRLSATFREQGVRKLLEVGVGTGRVAAALRARGFTLIGLDAAPNMLARAHAKGLDTLVLGGAYRLPFRKNSCDLALYVHVLHLLKDPRRALAEGVRVARYGACALVHPIPAGDDSDSGEGREAWRLVYRALEEAGWPIPPQRSGSHTREQALLAAHPPAKLVRLTDRQVTEPYSKTLDFIQAGGSRWLLHIPPEVLSAAVAQARERLGNRTFSYREVEAVAFWTGPPLPTDLRP